MKRFKLYNLFFIFAITLLVFSCQSDSTESARGIHSNVTSDDTNSNTTGTTIANVVIEDLKTDQQISDFLADLFEQDQSLRKQSSQIEQQFGYNSPESKAHYAKFMALDEILRIKAKRFLEVHGFPDPKRHGEKAYKAIIFVYHHTSSDNVMRHESLPIFYEAYKDGKLDESFFDFYLGRMYDNEFSKRIEMKSPFKSKDRIAKYLKAFNFSTN